MIQPDGVPRLRLPRLLTVSAVSARSLHSEMDRNHVRNEIIRRMPRPRSGSRLSGRAVGRKYTIGVLG